MRNAAKGTHDTLPVSKTFPILSRSPAKPIHSKDTRCKSLNKHIDKTSCSFSYYFPMAADDSFQLRGLTCLIPMLLMFVNQ